MTPHKNQQQPSVLALTGGVGGAKLALGLSRTLPADELAIVVNTADDFEHIGLPICPDLDTLMYTLAELNNTKQGWGLNDETWSAMQMLKAYGAETWFQLGDGDLATHLLRKRLLSRGQSLSEVTEHLFRQLGIQNRVLPMSDDPVSTVVETATADLAFQHYFVRDRCEPIATGFRYQGIEQAKPQPKFLAYLTSPQLKVIVICPSNPFVSVAPILQLPGVRDALQKTNAKIIAVSPIINGQAIKGPAAKMMAEMNMPVSSLGIADYYQGLVDGLIIDHSDSHFSDDILQRDMAVKISQTLMQTLEDRIMLAQTVLAFAKEIG